MAALLLPVLAAGGAYAYHRWQAAPESDNSPAGTGLRRRPLARRRPVPIPKDSRIATPDEECAICRDEPPHFPKDAPTAKCTHSSQVCLVCLRRMIEESVTAGTVLPDGSGIKCPSVDCREFLSYSDVQRWATETVFQRYDRAMVTSVLMGDPDFIRCLSCNAGQIHTGGDDNPLVTCYACNAKQCHRHNVEWHTDYTCKQWDKMHRKKRKAEDASIDAINALTKACPAPNCGRRLMKRGGCDHYTCQLPGGCGHQFCWLCLAPWQPIRDEDNSKHYDHCKYYSGEPGAHPSPFIIRKRRWWQIKRRR